MEPLVTSLSRLGAQLPLGSKFRFSVVGGRVELKLFGVVQPRRGVGTRFMADFLSVTDRHRTTVHLNVASTTAFGNPTLFEVGRWYGRLGFVTRHFTGDEWRIERAPRPTREGHVSILADYDANRLHDLAKDAFDEWMFAAFNPLNYGP